MNLTTRLTKLEQHLGTNDKSPEPLLVKFLGANTTDITGGILYVYKPHLNTEYRLTTEQIEQYESDQLDLSQLTPHNVVEY